MWYSNIKLCTKTTQVNNEIHYHAVLVRQAYQCLLTCSTEISISVSISAHPWYRRCNPAGVCVAGRGSEVKWVGSIVITLARWPELYMMWPVVHFTRHVTTNVTPFQPHVLTPPYFHHRSVAVLHFCRWLKIVRIGMLNFPAQSASKVK